MTIFLAGRRLRLAEARTARQHLGAAELRAVALRIISWFSDSPVIIHSNHLRLVYRHE